MRNSQQAGQKEEFTLLDSSGLSTPAIQPMLPSPPPIPLTPSALPNVPPAQPGPTFINLNQSLSPLSSKPKSSTLAKAINDLIKSNFSSSKPKLREPDPLNFSDPQKL